MKVYELRRTQLIKAPIDEIWAFFSSPKNLSALTPAYMKFTITSTNMPAETYPGQIITYKVSPIAGVPLFWMTEITHVDKNKLFVDEQRIGPYKIWHHEHHFVQQTDGVLMTDIVHYSLPVYFLGRIAHEIFIKKQLKDIFDYRHKKIEEHFGS
ncbi:MAG: SRPBCC family protein [Flavipsychrobacter sp.]|nr:SRPBCC family protein [Flavipsychrobacter sp.]